MKKELLIKAVIGGGLWVALLYAVDELLNYNGRLHCIIVLTILGILGNKLNSKSMKAYMWGVSICHLIFMYFEPPMRNYFWGESTAHFGGGWEIDWVMIILEVILVICITIMPMAVKGIRKEIKEANTEVSSKQMVSLKSAYSVNSVIKDNLTETSTEVSGNRKQDDTQNVQGSTLKTKREQSTSSEDVVVSTDAITDVPNSPETELQHDLQDVGQHDVDALYQFVQGLK